MALSQIEQKTHLFWEIQSVERSTLPPATLLNRQDSRYEEPHVLHRYRFGSDQPVREVHVHVMMRPIGLEILQKLVDRQLLEANILSLMPTYDLRSAHRVWRAEEATPQRTLSGRNLLCTSL